MKKRPPGRSHGASRGHAGARPAKRGGFSGGPGKPPRPANKGGSRRGGPGGERPSDYASYEREPATPEYMARLFAGHGFAVDPRELAAFWRYYELLRARNGALELTRIVGIEATVLKHFIDSAIVAGLTELAAPLVDIGSGPGFPGVPLAIRRPDLKIVLAESRGKRVRFLEEVKGELGLANVEIFPRSVREDSPLQAGGVITRALEVIPATLERVKHLLSPGGTVIFMKGPNCGGEITQAQQELKGVYKMTQDLRYDLAGSGQQRRLVVFAKREME